MICHFCDQWNPRGALRCSFCGNPPGAEADATDAAPRAYGSTLPPLAPAAAGLQARRPASGAPDRGSARRHPTASSATVNVLWTCAIVGGIALLVAVARCVF